MANKRVNVLDNGEWSEAESTTDAVYLCNECTEGHGEEVWHRREDES